MVNEASGAARCPVVSMIPDIASASTMDREMVVAGATLDRVGAPASHDHKIGTGPSRLLKIMHVTNSMALGGTEKIVLKLATKLTENFTHSICCLRNFDKELVGNWLSPGQLVALDLPQSRFAVFVPRLVRAIRACEPDIVHSRNWGGIEAVIAARLAGVPVVIHSEHGYDVGDLVKTTLRQRWMRRLVCFTANAVFTVSRELRDFHARQAGVRVDRIRVIYNGVDTEAFSPNSCIRARMRAEHGIAPEDFVIGAVGRIAAIKNYETLVRACAVLSRRNIRFKLVLVGDGPELPRLVELAGSFPELRACFIHPGRCDNVPDWLAAMDVFVQSSLSEGMSNTVLEAMATGLPVIATSVGGNAEVVEEGRTGHLFQPCDVESLADLLGRLAADPDRRANFGCAARLRVQESFSNESMLENYRDLYLELAKKRNVAGWDLACGELRKRGVERV